jgi:hypothetical protein
MGSVGLSNYLQQLYVLNFNPPPTSVPSSTNGPYIPYQNQYILNSNMLQSHPIPLADSGDRNRSILKV